MDAVKTNSSSRLYPAPDLKDFPPIEGEFKPTRETEELRALNSGLHKRTLEVGEKVEGWRKGFRSAGEKAGLYKEIQELIALWDQRVALHKTLEPITVAHQGKRQEILRLMEEAAELVHVRNYHAAQKKYLTAFHGARYYFGSDDSFTRTIQELVQNMLKCMAELEDDSKLGRKLLELIRGTCRSTAKSLFGRSKRREKQREEAYKELLAAQCKAEKLEKLDYEGAKKVLTSALATGQKAAHKDDAQMQDMISLVEERIALVNIRQFLDEFDA